MDMIIIAIITVALIFLWRRKAKAEQVLEDYMKEIKKCLK